VTMWPSTQQGCRRGPYPTDISDEEGRRGS
jgi:hypothetical protein